jgi:uncharacterized protein
MDKTFKPRLLDIQAFAQAGAELQGQTPLSEWPRLQAEQFAAGPAEPGAVQWHLQGRTVPVTGGAPQMGLHLRAEVNLAMQCQRCLGPVVERIVAERDFLFVADEATAEAMDEDSEADVLVISRDFDALSLIEDELILALPLVPRHDVCPQEVPAAVADEAFEQASQRPNPFAVLAKLKKTD